MKAFAIAALFLSSLLSASVSHATCVLMDSQGRVVSIPKDAIGSILKAAPLCPTDVFQFRAVLARAKLKLRTSMVANRGFHNPSQGSFSLFETATGPRLAPGDFFFGHFTAVDGSDRLTPDQNPAKSSLMIEAFAWDPVKGFYNFYELRGNGTEGQWFYRGDSADILADNALLHRQPDPKAPVFGDRLRCSACHAAGGPVMKELRPPHNDWWNPKRKLDFGGRVPDARLAEILKTLVPADRLAMSVAAGLKKLEMSPSFRAVKSQRSLQEELRPLFCPVEVNFQSDLAPNGEQASAVRVPTEFFVDSRLVPKALRNASQRGIGVARSDYESALNRLGSRFPETALTDSDHAWLTPVKSRADKNAVSAFVGRDGIDGEFIADVLAVDFTNPVFSRARCALLRFVPDSKGTGWKKLLASRLEQSQAPFAKELAANLADPARDAKFHAKRVAAFLGNCVARLKDAKEVAKLTVLLNQRRGEIGASEISKNPRGQILEPGFRVIFPRIATPTPAGRLRLSEECTVVL